MHELSTATGPGSCIGGAAAGRDIQKLSIGQYLIGRLEDYGIGHVFGIPGDYILNFYSQLEQSPIEVVGCTREDCAGFAADGYARVHGMGAVCVTYCVGGFSLCNSIAGAYAEKSPVVVITGSPGVRERANNPLLHHRVRDFRTQLEVFQKICIAGAELNDPLTARWEIDRVLETADRYKRPVYLEIPRDMVSVVPEAVYRYEQPQRRSDPASLAEAVAEALDLLNRCQRPIIIAGVEIHRFGLQQQVMTLVEDADIPITATILGKSVICETHPLYAGLYEGALGEQRVTQFVEDSDCVLLLGAFLTDINLGIYSANLDPARCIYATSEELRIGYHHYHDVLLEEFLAGLAAAGPRPARREPPPPTWLESARYQIREDAPITTSRLIGRLNQSLDDQTVVVVDIGDSLFAATDLVTHGQTEFLGPAYYASMGFAVPATLGVHMARPEARLVTIVGDGAFQMTGMELSTFVRHKIPAIVIVLDNGGYGTERFLHPGDWKFNEIYPWAYHRLPAVLGAGTGYDVSTEGEFDRALRAAWTDDRGLSVIQVRLRADDGSRVLARLAERLRDKV